MDATQPVLGKTMRNIHASMIVSGILAVEQLLYGILVSSHGSRTQQIYLLSAGLVFVVFLLCFPVKRRVHRISALPASIMELVPPFVAMIVALTRIIWFEGTLYSISTMYLAIRCGTCVIIILLHELSGLFFLLMMVGGIVCVFQFTGDETEVPFLSENFVSG